MLARKLAVQITAGIVVVIGLLTVLVCVMGYRAFTDSSLMQYEDAAHNTARTAAEFLTPEVLTDELSEADFQVRLKELNDYWATLADTQDATFIYLIRPDKSDYNHIKFLLSVMNSSEHYDIFPSGYIRETTNDEYRQAYKDICENGRTKAVILRDNGDSATGHHITVMIPFKTGYSDSVDWILCVQRPMELLSFYRKYYVRHVAVTAVVIAVLVLIVYGSYLGRALIRPVQSIAGEAKRFAVEHTKPALPLREKITAKNEIGQLAGTIDAMESQILSYVDSITRITQEREQIKAELNVAADIQLSMLPREFPQRKEFEIFATMTPAKEVSLGGDVLARPGGDFYDFFMIDDDHLALVIADVSGKGVPAALFMVNAKTLINSRAQMGGSPAEILADVNNLLCESNEAELFVTVWLGILELSTGRVTASNAGHEYPAIRNIGGGYELFRTRQSPALAMFEGVAFKPSECTLEPGDSLYIYTDGVPEAKNIDGKLFGLDRMLDVLNTTAGMTAEEVLAAVKRSVDDFTGDAPQFDDVTMLYVKFLGGGRQEMHELITDAVIENLDEVLDFLGQYLEEWECPMKTQTQINIAAEEIFVNIANYAYKPGTGKATIKIEHKDNSAEITFIDSGTPYDPLAKPDPDVTLSAEERDIGGLGIYIVKKSMDNVSYEYKDGCNILTLTKKIG